MQSSKKYPQAPFQKLTPLEMRGPEGEEEEEEEDHQSKKKSNFFHVTEDGDSIKIPKKFIYPPLILLFMISSGMLFAFIGSAAFSSPDNTEEGASQGSGEKLSTCSTNTLYSSQTLKPLIDRPVAALLKPIDLKG